jgi:PAS domain S-box-containing protein
MALMDLNSRCIATNAALQNMYGYSDEELRSLTALEITHPDDVAATRAALAEFVSGARQEYHIEKRFIRKGGTPLWVNVTTTLVPATDVTPAMLQGVSINIDDRKRAEAALRASEERFRTVFAASPVGIAASDENRRLLKANPALQRMLGYSEDELRALGWVGLTHEDDRAASWEWVTSVLAGQRPPALEKRYVRKDGEILWAAVDASFVPATETAPAFMATIIADITDRVRAEEALQRSQSELARVSRITTMGQLAASIAHEINQPLTAIIASGNACERWLANGENLARARQSLARMIGEADRASEVIKRMRSLTGNAASERVELDINAVVREVLALARNELQAKRVRVQLNLNGDIAPARADRVQLQQVLLNLIVNAIDAMAGVTGRARVLAIATRCDASAGVLVTVQDSGVGLAPDGAEYIFQPFFTSKPGGTGMGLSISTTIIEAHGGRLWASPAPEHGAVFHFTLPSAA